MFKLSTIFRKTATATLLSILLLIGSNTELSGASQLEELIPLLPSDVKSQLSDMDLNAIDTSDLSSLKSEKHKKSTLATPAKPAANIKTHTPSKIANIFENSEDSSNFNIIIKQSTKDINTEPQTNRIYSGSEYKNQPEQIPNKANTQYGYDFFNNSNLSQLNQKQIPIGTSYLLGPGDELLVYVWGKVQQKFILKLNEQGEAFIPQIGTIALAGTKFGDLEKVLSERMQKKYTNFSLSISISKLRTIRISILGEVNNPGTYDISSLSTALTALKSASGPTQMGSLRNIKVIRNKITIQTIDLYDYLLSGDKSNDIRLEASDTLFVPIIGKIVSINGMVKRPGIFEIKKKDSLSTVINKYAGGLTPKYYSKKIQISRILEGEKLIVENINSTNTKSLNRKIKKISLKSGDSISVLAIDGREHNFVTTQGNLYRPGKYEYTNDLTIGDLITLSNGLKPDTYMERVEIYRYIAKDQRELITVNLNDKEARKTKIHEWDILRIYTQAEIYGKSYVEIYGTVKTPGVYRLLKGMKAHDLIFIAGLLPHSETQSIELIRKNPSTITYFDLKESKDSIDTSLILKQGDIINIKEIAELTKENKVKISGEVKFPGIYLIKENETLTDIIARAGGLTAEAFIQGTELLRDSAKKKFRQASEIAFAQEEKELLFNQPAITSKSKETQEFIQSKASSYINSSLKKDNGRVILKIKDYKSLVNSSMDVELENKDSIYIPKTPSSIQILGGVQIPGSLVYESGKTLSEYVKDVGGYTEFAKKKDILIIHANGVIEKNTKQIALGDTIYIPEKIKLPINWFEVLKSSTAIIFNLATSYHIISLIGN